MTRHATEKDRSLKTQLLVANTDGENEIAEEKLWASNCFLWDEKSVLNKVNHSENTLLYMLLYASVIKLI